MKLPPKTCLLSIPLVYFDLQDLLLLASLCLLSSQSSFFPYAVVKVHGFPLNKAAPSGAGGDNEIRTRDLLLARQALSQLSYAPVGVRERALKIEQ